MHTSSTMHTLSTATNCSHLRTSASACCISGPQTHTQPPMCHGLLVQCLVPWLGAGGRPRPPGALQALAQSSNKWTALKINYKSNGGLQCYIPDSRRVLHPASQVLGALRSQIMMRWRAILKVLNRAMLSCVYDWPFDAEGAWIVTLTLLAKGIRTVDDTPPDFAVRPIIAIPHGEPSVVPPGLPVCALLEALLNRDSPASSSKVI